MMKGMHIAHFLSIFCAPLVEGVPKKKKKKVSEKICKTFPVAVLHNNIQYPCQSGRGYTRSASR